MKSLKVSAIVIASTLLATNCGPAEAGKERGSVYDRVCSSPTQHSHHYKMGDQLAEFLNLTDAQKGAYKEFVEARTKAVDDTKASLCATKPDLTTFETRLTFHQDMLEARLASLKLENPKLLAFYKSLDADQKERFDRFRSRRDRE